MKRIMLLLAAPLALAGCETPAPMGPEPMAAVDLNNPLFAPAYMANAASGDLLEIQSSQLALQMSQNPAVRGFANMLIAHHSQMSQTMAAAAQAARLMPPPPALLPPHQAMLDQLRAAGSGAAFDLAFKQMQVAAHQQALMLHQNYAASGDHPALRPVAAQAVPTIQMHLQQAQALNVSPPPPPYPPATTGTRAGERG